MVVNCVRCNVEIIDPNFKVLLYQEDYPDILIGPYCEDCLCRIKICCGCNHPFYYKDLQHLGDGEYFCASCVSNIKVCSCCMKKIGNSAYKEAGGSIYCDTCYNQYFFLCNVCGKEHHKDSAIYRHSQLGMSKKGIFRKYKGEYVCSDCFERKSPFYKTYLILSCKKCGSLYEAKDEHHIYCEDCWDRFFICTTCSHKSPSVKRINTVNGRDFICETCLKDYKPCDSCGLFSKEDLHKKVYQGSVYNFCKHCKDKKPCKNCGSFFISDIDYCDSCAYIYINNICKTCGTVRDHKQVCRHCSRVGIYSYGTKLSPYWINRISDKDNGIIFGIENEVSYGESSKSLAKRDEAVSRIYTSYDPKFLMLKSDSSINGYGFEVVTQPMTLDYLYSKDISNLFDKDMRFSPSCGLHIHVSRDSFISDLHLFKVVNFIHTNSKLWRTIAGRGDNSYSNSFQEKITRVVKNAKNHSGERYCKVNMTSSRTIEFRSFAGCIREIDLRARVEFLHALIQFMKTESTQSSSKAFGVKRYLGYISKNMKSYPSAIIYASENGIDLQEL